MTVSIGELLKEPTTEKTSSQATAPETTKETPTEEAKTEVPTEEPKVEVSETKSEEPAAPVKKEKTVPFSALHEERMKRRELKAKVDQLEKKVQELSGSYSSSPSESETEGKGKDEFFNSILHISVNSVRATRPDADEMLSAFDEAVEENEDLYNLMRKQPDPGAFAYEYGRTIKDKEKYGATPEEAFKKAWAEAEKATKEKVFKELKTKKDIGERLPKNISSGASSGSGSDAPAWRPDSSKEIWG